MFQTIQAFIITLTLTAFTFADVFMTELTDPQNSSDAGRYVELYNNGSEDVDLSSGWALQRWTNGNTDPQSAKPLTGVIGSGEFYIVCTDEDKHLAIYGTNCDQDIGTGGPADSNGDDNMALLGASGAVVDMFGLSGEDGSGTGHEFEDGRAERSADNTAASAIWDESGWNIDNDSGGGDGNQYAPEGFDPRAWIGAVVATCDDEAACNTGSEGDCTYAETDYDCDGNCTAANVDWAGDQNDDGFLEFDGSTVYVNVESYPNLGSAILTVNGSDVSMNYEGWGDNAHWYSGFETTSSTTYDWSVTVSNSCGTSQTVSDSFGTDCYNVVGGMAVLDDCNVCDGDGSSCGNCDDDAACNTGELGACVYIADGECDCNGNVLDCAGVCNGSSVSDDCGVCDGGNASMDCAGTCGGAAIEDCAGTCGGAAIEDCAGTCGGDVVIDGCAVCGGSNDCWPNVTFNLNMTLEDVSPDGVALHGIDGDWVTGIAMADDDGDGVYSTTLKLAPELNLYKFKNGGTWESVDELECAWLDENFWDRYVDLTDVTEDMILGSVCFGLCDDCPVEILGCTDPEAENYNPEANVDDDSCTYPQEPEGFVIYMNEIHYDNAGGDVEEGVEVVASAGMDAGQLAQITLTKYNGNNGTEYGSHSLSDFTEGITLDDLTYYHLFISSLQNGAPDGLALSGWGSSYQLLSYEGTLTATNGPANGETSTDIEVSEDGSTEIGTSMQFYGDAGWLSGVTSSFGDVNPAPCSDENACNYGEISDCTYADSGYNCDGMEIVNVTFQLNMEEQTVDTEGYGLDLWINSPSGYHDMNDDDDDGIWSVTLVLEAGSYIEYKFKNGDNWEFDNWEEGLDCLVANEGYWNRSTTLGDSDTVLDSVCFNSCSDCEEACAIGDVNGDGDVNVLDVVAIVSYIVNEGDDFDTDCADTNADGSIDVLDVVAIVSDIVNGRVAVDATSAKLIKSENALTLQADGYIGGVQMTLRHDADFTIELSENAWISDYSTSGNQTILVLVEPAEGELFTTSGNFEIADMIVANSNSEIDVALVSQFGLSAAYPNPFNPSTTINLHVENEGLVKVSVFNLAGKEVAQLSNEFVVAGIYSMTWVADGYPSGVYLIRSNMMGATSVQKIILLK